MINDCITIGFMIFMISLATWFWWYDKGKKGIVCIICDGSHYDMIEELEREIDIIACWHSHQEGVGVHRWYYCRHSSFRRAKGIFIPRYYGYYNKTLSLCCRFSFEEAKEIQYQKE